MQHTKTSAHYTRWEPWELAFIRLAYPDNDTESVGQIIGRTEASVGERARKLRLRKIPSINPGDEFERLHVVCKTEQKRRNCFLWLCRCKCGNDTYATSWELKRLHVRSCGCLLEEHRRSLYIDDIPGAFFRQIEKNARFRAIPFRLTHQQIADIYAKQGRRCALSGLTIGFRRRGQPSTETTASLDRIDPDLPYEIGNVQFVHKNINWMKLDFTQGEFIELCRRVAEHNVNNRDKDAEGGRKKTRRATQCAMHTSTRKI